MSASKTVIGAVVGAVVGVIAHVVLEAYVMKSGEAPWMAVVIGLLTGLGVRKLDPTVVNTVSYLRGALSALIALAGIVGGMQVVAKAVQARNASAVTSAPKAPAQPAAEPAVEAEGEAAAAEEAPVEAAPVRESAPLSLPAAGRMKPRKDFSPIQFAMIAVGAFLAYELARGSSKVAVAEEAAPVEPNPSLPPVD
jgi:hypothetical protein